MPSKTLLCSPPESTETFLFAKSPENIMAPQMARLSELLRRGFACAISTATVLLGFKSFLLVC